ncbi:unnamed protein product, partial [Durusdinium trenchii]
DVPKKASKAAAKPAAAKPAPKALLKDKPSSSKTSGQEASKEALTEQEQKTDTAAPLHLDQDLVLLKKSDDELEHVKEGSQKKKKAQNKKNVIPASEWFQG